MSLPAESTVAPTGEEINRKVRTPRRVLCIRVWADKHFYFFVVYLFYYLQQEHVPPPSWHAQISRHATNESHHQAKRPRSRPGLHDLSKGDWWHSTSGPDNTMSSSMSENSGDSSLCCTRSPARCLSQTRWKCCVCPTSACEERHNNKRI